MNLPSKPILSHCRVNGVLLHPTSFPSPFGIGDLGPGARRFIDFLAETGQQLWQVLPLGPTGFGNSPYMCYSALAGNPLLISPELLRDRGLLHQEDFADVPQYSLDRVDYEQVEPYKMALLKKACENFRTTATEEQRHEFNQFCQGKAYWLDDYALFMAIKKDQNGASWHTWAPELAYRKHDEIEKCRLRLTGEIFFQKFLQYEFARQWSELKEYANSRSIYIVGDIPIYVAHDSADVWSHPANFSLDVKTGEPAMMAGVPPDYFSATGQLWGNPIYNWGRLKKTNFEWWIQRFRALRDYVDYIRIDHFRGFEGFWAIPKGETTAIKGRWVKAPGYAFFEALRDELGELPIMAEDLGVITPEVEALRDRFEFPGMRVLHFAFGSDPANPFLPFNFCRNCVVYTGTHDNNTTVGWFENDLNDYERRNVLNYLGGISQDGIHWDLIRLAMSSIANVAIIPLQDIMGAGSEARMNRPSIAEGNWEWRYREEELVKDVRDRLATLTWLFGRAPASWL
ncbi:4-alpha-glucanotransferase [Leptothermofonsia sp. ETS-13]|uniref:4-alpha-glucanotransferase n=1 Tax=Leptothermofonsia sp. ETS-13 TaxID=3035696 RepID=UPI003BA0D800